MRITRGALVAALYVVLVVAFQPISFGYVQFRVAEALALLPFLWPEAVPGLFIGCLVSNFYGGLGVFDIVFGSAATLIAAVLSSFAKTPGIAAIPPVAVNGLVVGTYLSYITDVPIWLSIPFVASGEAIACFALGIPLVKLLKRMNIAEKRFSPLIAGKSLAEPVNLLTSKDLTNQSENSNRAKHDVKSDYHVNKSDEENQQNYVPNTGSEGR